MRKLYTNKDYHKFGLRNADKDSSRKLSDDFDKATLTKEKKRVFKNYKKEQEIHINKLQNDSFYSDEENTN